MLLPKHKKDIVTAYRVLVDVGVHLFEGDPGVPVVCRHVVFQDLQRHLHLEKGVQSM
jgi:hypothetical protein